MHTTALGIFCLVFLFVTLAGFWAARWRRPAAGMHSLEEWGLAGRSFGTWVTWFLIGGDLYTAYTVIAVPAALYGAGAMGFFARPLRGHRVSVHDAGPPAHLDHLSPARLHHLRGLRRRPLRQSLADRGRCHHRHPCAHAVHRAAARRHARRDRRARQSPASGRSPPHS